jgi:hypothetical protein
MTHRFAVGVAVAATILIGTALTFKTVRAHAKSAAADDCWKADGVYGTACEHVFSDGTTCVVFSRVNGTNAGSPMQCKFN